MASRVTLGDLTEGDLVLFNDRQQPLTVTAVEQERVFVAGPQGGEYMLFLAEDDPEALLVAKPGNRRYASYVEDLRTVGEWRETGDQAWEHTATGATVRVEKTDAGFWTVTVHDFAGDPPDIPKYGFTEEEIAVQEARSLIEANPEG